MYETRKNQDKKVLGDLSLVEEIFTTVASCDIATRNSQFGKCLHDYPGSLSK